MGKKKIPQTQRSMMEKKVAPLLQQQTSNQLGVFPKNMKMLRTRRQRRSIRLVIEGIVFLHCCALLAKWP
jgi:hypothetical protein